MKRSELADRLAREDVPTDVYSLEGGMLSDRFCLDRVGNGWEVYYSERGKRYDVCRFEAEEAACDYFFAELMKILNRS